MEFSEEDRILMHQGFRDAMERRDLPLPEYTKEQIKVWRVGLSDGFKFSKHYSTAYHAVRNKLESSLRDPSFLTQGFVSEMTNTPVPASEMSKENRVKWNQGRRYAILFKDVYETDYVLWLNPNSPAMRNFFEDWLNRLRQGTLS